MFHFLDNCASSVLQAFYGEMVQSIVARSHCQRSNQSISLVKGIACQAYQHDIPIFPIADIFKCAEVNANIEMYFMGVINNYTFDKKLNDELIQKYKNIK